MDARAVELLAHAVELERRDEQIAAATARIAELARRAGETRAEAGVLSAALEALPGELADVERAHGAALEGQRLAVVSLEAAEERVVQLESSRRSRETELDQARRELSYAQQELHDAQARVRRYADRRVALLAEERALVAQGEGLVVGARSIAAAIGETPRIPDAARAMPGSSVAELEEWGAQVRAALFVARGGLDLERTRLVEEANALGAAILGEPLGASSIALVRARIEERIGPVRELG